MKARLFRSFAWAAVVALALPASAWACPFCARDAAGPAYLVLLGAMILLPFGVVAVLVPYLRRASR